MKLLRPLLRQSILLSFLITSSVLICVFLEQKTLQWKFVLLSSWNISRLPHICMLTFLWDIKWLHVSASLLRVSALERNMTLCGKWAGLTSKNCYLCLGWVAWWRALWPPQSRPCLSWWEPAASGHQGGLHGSPKPPWLLPLQSLDSPCPLCRALLPWRPAICTSELKVRREVAERAVKHPVWHGPISLVPFQSIRLAV